MNINNQSHLAGDRHRLSQESTRTTAGAQGADPLKQANVAQATVKAVQEALARINPTQSSSQPSAHLSIESAKIAKSTSIEKVGNDEELDITRLDALKAKIADGSFEIDFGLLARQLVEHSVQHSSSKRGK